ncbi:aspartyl-phosphate phosphatase Spo0E family protein [Paenibacillus endoradicis]|uniref:aspartyl-phosphate phosphatase Spo0E family protein n=1 Tax=Paenibacillus endoradicis TaxID=2972487 RepID=UPI002158E747|nr:aspartyl-phosphate phosphatase Spo0E family protein [Paenibacillus endoradicis]MCR8660427.1 aspartyl-phosphate phosphatase Spo0E family protein [Paenibacillus endoradicis]
MEKKQLMTQLQSLRHKLYEIAEAKGSFTDPDVIAISEEADQLIVALQYMERNQEYYLPESYKQLNNNVRQL